MLNGLLVVGMTGDDAIAITGHFAPVATACREEKYVITLEVRRSLKHPVIASVCPS